MLAIWLRIVRNRLLNLDKINEESLERFEREVQIACQLNHPNTIAIYDYGRTPEDVFYYAMEFIESIDLTQLEHAIPSCLEKKRAMRPQTARDLAQLLDKCPTAHTWTVEDGDAWWSRHARGVRKRSEAETDAPPPLAEGSAVLEQTIDHS